MRVAMIDLYLSSLYTLSWHAGPSINVCVIVRCPMEVGPQWLLHNYSHQSSGLSCFELRPSTDIAKISGCPCAVPPIKDVAVV